MSSTFKRIASWLVFVIVLFAFLFLAGVLMDIQQACREPEAAISIASTTGQVMVEAIALPIPAITSTNGASEIEGISFITTTTRIYGELLDVVIDYATNISATTDLTLTHVGLINEVVLVKADSATDTTYRARALAVTSAGASTTYEFVPFTLAGSFLVNIGQTTPVSATGTLYIRYRR